MANVRRDLTSQRFGRLTVVKRVENSASGGIQWLCTCDCGNKAIVMSGNLLNGHTQSCGCLQKERTSEVHTVHSHYYGKDGKRSSLYRVWEAMKRRCLNPNDYFYDYYGGRGISVCSQWMEYEAFYDWALRNGYKKGLTIDRIDVNGNYEPSNCRWSTAKEQGRNKRNNIFLTYDGRTLLLVEWAELLDIDPKLLRNRLRRGWTIERTLSQPVKKKEEVS